MNPNRIALVAVTLAGGLTQPGCILSPILRNEEISGSHSVKSKYDGLAGKSFAVVVSADRMVQADYPQLVAQLTTTIGRRLSEEVDASGWIPPDKVLEFQYKNPRWSVMRPDELARALGVERLILVEVTEFRLTEPGNQYLWRGMAAGTVGVVEADGATPEVFAFQEAVRTTYPVQERAVGPAQIPQDAIQVALAKKFINRAAYLFYDHDEKNVETDQI